MSLLQLRCTDDVMTLVLKKDLVQVKAQPPSAARAPLQQRGVPAQTWDILSKPELSSHGTRARNSACFKGALPRGLPAQYALAMAKGAK